MSETLEKKQKKSTFFLIGIAVAVLYCILNYIKFEYFSSHLAEMSMTAAAIFIFILVIQFMVAQYSIKLNDGIFDFKKVFQAMFIVLLVYELGFVLSHYLYMFHIHPAFIQEFHDRNEIAVEVINKNWDKEQKKQALQAILDMKHVSAGSLVLLYFKEVIFSSIFAFVIAFFIKFLNRSRTPYIYHPSDEPKGL